MIKTHFLRQILSHYALLIAAICFLSPALNCSVHPQASTPQQPVVVTGQAVPTAYSEEGAQRVRCASRSFRAAVSPTQ